jgi:hypothetical protein
MKNLPIAAVLGCLVALTVSGCNRPATDGKVLATVNGAPITERDLEFSALPSGHGEKRPPKDLDYLLAEELLSQQGIKLGLDRDPSYQKQVARLQQKGHGMSADTPRSRSYQQSQLRTEMARRVFDTQIAAKVEVSRAEAQSYFQAQRERINTELHLGLIRFEQREQAEKALRAIRRGTPFESLARQAQATPAVSSQKAGARPDYDLGFLPWREIPIDFTDRLYRLKPGEVSEILGNQVTGFQLVKLYQSRPSPRPIDFPQASGSVMNPLRDLKLLEAHRQYLAQLKKEAKIVMF